MRVATVRRGGQSDQALKPTHGLRYKPFEVEVLERKVTYVMPHLVPLEVELDSEDGQGTYREESVAVGVGEGANEEGRAQEESRLRLPLAQDEDEKFEDSLCEEGAEAEKGPLSLPSSPGGQGAHKGNNP
eukprot:3712082-Pyramimonas_sp.AAC.1